MKSRAQVLAALWLLWTIAIALGCGCASTGPTHYRMARPTCLQWANAACIAALQSGCDSGVAVIWKAEAQVMHAVIWVQGPGESQPRWYDPINGRYIQAPQDPVWGPTRGPTLAWFGAAGK